MFFRRKYNIKVILPFVVSIRFSIFPDRLSCSHVCSEQDQFSSVAQSCQTLCNTMDCSMQSSLSITNSWSLLKLMSIVWVMPYNRLILCRHLLLLPSIFPRIRVGEGNGTSLQYSCLENPRDRGAWWAAVYGVAQSWTQLK